MALRGAELLFASKYHELKDQVEAYQIAYDCTGLTDSAIANRASKLAGKERVQSHTLLLDAASTEAVIITAAYKRQLLLKHSKDADPRVSMMALDQLNKLDGDYAPERHEVSTALNYSADYGIEPGQSPELIEEGDVSEEPEG